MTYTYHPYGGDYTQYGYNPEWNWWQWLYGDGGPDAGSDGSSSPGSGSSSGASQPPATAGGRAPGVGVLGLLGDRDHNVGGRPSGGPVTPTGHTTSPYGGEAPSITSKGALFGLADMLDPTPGNLLGQAVRLGYAPDEYLDTKPMTIPGVATMATQPGLARAFLGNVPFGGALANMFGQATANRLSDIANHTMAGDAGYGIGRYGDMYGRTQTMGIDPSGPFGTSAITGTAGPAQFGWQGVHRIAQDLRTQNAPHDFGDHSRDPGRSGSNRGGPGTGRGQPGGATSDRPDRLTRGGRVGALNMTRDSDGVWRLCEGGAPVQEFGLGGIVKKIAPVAAGALASYFTGSDIAGGIAAGGTAKLLGNDWGDSLAYGALTGLGSYLTGLSSDGPGIFGLGSVPVDAGDRVAASVNTTSGDKGGGLFSGISDLFGGKSDSGILGGAAALSLLGGLAGGDAEQPDDADYTNASDDPAYTDKVKKGWTLDRSATPPPDDFNWYAYGQIPQYQFFDNVNADAVPNMAKGGDVGNGNRAALSILNSVSAVKAASGGGQDDKVPAILAPDEHVIDADVVAAIGDGSSDEGHRRLEKMKQTIRKTKRSAAPSKIPPKAKPPLQYLAEAR